MSEPRKSISPANDQVAWKGLPKRGGNFEAPSIVDEGSLTNMRWQDMLIDASDPTQAKTKNSRGRAVKAVPPKG